MPKKNLLLFIFMLFFGFVYAQPRHIITLQKAKELYEKGDFKNATIEFNITCEQASGEGDTEVYIDALIYLTKIQRLNNDLVGALESYNRLIEADKKNPVFYNNRGNIQDELGKHSQSLLDYGQAIALNLTYKNAYYNRAIAYYHLSEWENSKADFLKVIELDKNDKDAYFGLGLTNQKLEYIKEACEALQKAKQLGSEEAKKELEKIKCE
jgi:tetratricopeptide (TPR) repeat protein